MSSWSFEYKEKIYRQLLERREKGKGTIEDVDLVVIIAEWLMACFPSLLEPCDKWTLMMALKMKFDKVYQDLLECKQADFHSEQDSLETFGRLIRLGVFKPPAQSMKDDLPF